MAFSPPPFVKIKNYRTMTDQKKKLAVKGVKKYQLEWMTEEINEFYEAIYLQNLSDILNESIGLIRTAQQFRNSKRVLKKWRLVSGDVLKVLFNKKIFTKAFKLWKQKKTIKHQAKGVKVQHLMRFSGFDKFYKTIRCIKR